MIHRNITWMSTLAFQGRCLEVSRTIPPLLLTPKSDFFSQRRACPRLIWFWFASTRHVSSTACICSACAYTKHCLCRCGEKNQCGKWGNGLGIRAVCVRCHRETADGVAARCPRGSSLRVLSACRVRHSQHAIQNAPALKNPGVKKSSIKK